MRPVRLAALAAVAVAVGAWRFHPVHAARIELDSTGRAVTAVVRVYREDFPPGVERTAVLQYLAKTIRVTDVAGGVVTLRLVSLAPEGDRLRIALQGDAAAPLARGKVAITLLQERFADQVNVAVVRVDGRRAQLVFLRGDPPQPLP